MKKRSYSKIHKREIGFFLILLFILLTIYLEPSLHASYVFDDRAFFVSNWKIESATIKDIFTKSYWSFAGDFNYKKGYYRPLVILSFYLEQKIFGANSKVSHLINLFLFIIIVFLFYYFLKLEKTGYEKIITILFLLHPAHTDNVMWIVGRCDLFPIIFFLLSLISIKKRNLFLLFFSILMGFLSKESFFIYTVIIFAFIFLEIKNKNLKVKLVTYISIFLFTYLIFNKMFFTDNPIFFNFKSIKTLFFYFLGNTIYFFSSSIGLIKTPFIGSIPYILKFKPFELILNTLFMLLVLTYYNYKKNKLFLIFILSTIIFLGFNLFLSTQKFMPPMISKRFVQGYILFLIPIMFYSLKNLLRNRTLLYITFSFLILNWMFIDNMEASKYSSDIKMHLSLLKQSEGDLHTLSRVSDSYFVSGDFYKSLKYRKKAIENWSNFLKKYNEFYDAKNVSHDYIGLAKANLAIGKCDKALRILHNLRFYPMKREDYRAYLILWNKIYFKNENFGLIDLSKFPKINEDIFHFSMRIRELIAEGKFKTAENVIKKNRKYFKKLSDEFIKKIKKAKKIKNQKFIFYTIVERNLSACRIGPPNNSIFMKLKHIEACIEGCERERAYTILKELEKNAKKKKDKKLLYIISKIYYYRLADYKNYKRLKDEIKKLN